MALAHTVQQSTPAQRPRTPSTHCRRTAPAASPCRPLALVVFLENVGYVHGVRLPPWTMAAIDWATEEYAKLLLRLLGAHRRYDRIVILEDDRATAQSLTGALVELSATHTVDQLLLVHGQERCLVGYRGREFVDAAAFDALLARYTKDNALLDLRVVYGVNCYRRQPCLHLAGAGRVRGQRRARGQLVARTEPEPLSAQMAERGAIQ